MVGHAPEHDRHPELKGAQPRWLSVMPFPRSERCVAVFPQKLGEQFGVGKPESIHMEPRFAAHQHRPAGDAHGAAVAAENVIPTKAEPGFR